MWVFFYIYKGFKSKKFKNMTNEQLENIIYNPESSEEDVIIASIEKGHKDIKEGKYYTTEEIIEYFNNLATSC